MGPLNSVCSAHSIAGTFPSGDAADLASPEKRKPQRPRPAAPHPPERPQQLLSLLWTLNKNPLEAWPRHHYEESIVVGETFLGRFAMVNAPDAIRQVLVDDCESYRKDDLQNLLLKPALGNGLLTTSGSEWRIQRRAFAPAFSPRNVASYAPAMWQEARALSDRWMSLDGSIIDVCEQMARTMLDTLSKTLFSRGIGRDPDEFRSAATRYFETQGRIDPLDLIGAPAWIPRVGRLLSRPALKFFPKVVEAILSERRGAARFSKSGADADFVDILFNTRDDESGDHLSDTEIAANIITFIGAGFETPANALSWTFYLLSIDEEWREKVEREVDQLLAEGISFSAVPEEFVVTRALIEEAMRLYPPVAILSRSATRDHDLRGHTIREGTTVIISPWVLHRHRLLWDAPDRFDPAKFMPENRGRIPRYTYIPFGAGPRVCIGGAYAMQQMTATIAMIVRSFRLDLASGHKVMPVHRVTLRPEGGMKMRLTRRR
ncbi:MAG: cytochrome P450 [Proteobacteria bacterium]|nr:cytochrome P450 [Pseudomonadota bacterium]